MENSRNHSYIFCVLSVRSDLFFPLYLQMHNRNVTIIGIAAIDLKATPNW